MIIIGKKTTDCAHLSFGYSFIIRKKNIMWTFWFSNFLLALFPFPTSPIKRDMKLYSLRLKPLEQSSMLAMTDINLEQSMKNIN